MDERPQEGKSRQVRRRCSRRLPRGFGERLAFLDVGARKAPVSQSDRAEHQHGRAFLIGNAPACIRFAGQGSNRIARRGNGVEIRDEGAAMRASGSYRAGRLDEPAALRLGCVIRLFSMIPPLAVDAVWTTLLVPAL